MPGAHLFRTVVASGGGNTTGLVIPDAVVAALGSGRRPAVRVTVAGHSYPSTVSAMGGRFLVPLSSANRTAAGVSAGDEVEVTLVADTGPREVAVPGELAAALADEPAVRAFFDGLSHTDRKEWARWITEAKRPETRERRLTATLEALRAGRRTR